MPVVIEPLPEKGIVNSTVPLCRIRILIEIGLDELPLIRVHLADIRTSVLWSEQGTFQCLNSTEAQARQINLMNLSEPDVLAAEIVEDLYAARK